MGVCQIFWDQQSFKKSPFTLKWSGGTYNSENIFSVFCYLGSKNARTILPNRKKTLAQVIVHESWHQYVHQTYKCALPILMNEGMAEYFEHHYDQGRLAGKVPDRQLAKVQHMLARIQGKARVTNGFANINEYQRDVHYELGYAMCYYILHGCTVDGNKQYANIIHNYFAALRQPGRTLPGANKIAWRGIEQKQFFKDMTKFWNSSKLLRMAENNVEKSQW